MKFSLDEKNLDIVTKAITGDKSAINRIIELVARNVLYIAYSTLKNQHDAEDAAQEALIRIIQNFKQLTNPRAFSTWMYKVTVNTALDMKRKTQKRALTQSFTIADCANDVQENYREFLPQEFAEDKDKQELLVKVIDNLSARMRLCVMLYYYGDLNYRQIAEVLGIKEKDVNNTLYQARKKIKTGLEKKMKSKLDSAEYLYSIASLPVLAYVLQQQATATVAPQAVQNLVAGAQVSAGTATATGAAVASASSVKIALGIVAAVVVAGGFILGNVVNQGPEASPPLETNPVTVTEQPPLPGETAPARVIETLEDLIGEQNADQLRGFVENGAQNNEWVAFLAETGSVREDIFMTDAGVYSTYWLSEQDKQLILIGKTKDEENYEVAYRFCDLTEPLPHDVDIYFAFDEWRA